MKRIQELDALRGLAALMVVFFHFTLHRSEAGFGFKLGTTGVDLFFIISGFVISMSLNSAKDGLTFVINRAARLYPTYWAVVTFTFILIRITTSNENMLLHIIEYLGNMTMFQFYLSLPDLDGPYWTMIIEMLFYIVMLALFKFNLLQHIRLIGAAICLLVTFISVLFWNDHTQSAFELIPLLEFFPLFFAGIMFYQIHSTQNDRFLNYLLIVGCLICQILLFNHAGRSRLFIDHLSYSVMLVIFFSLFTLFVNNKLKFIVTKPTLFLGKISFALYLVHQFVSIGIIYPYFVDKLHYNFWLITLCVALPTVIGIATLITYKIEIPFGVKMKEKLRTNFYADDSRFGKWLWRFEWS